MAKLTSKQEMFCQLVGLKGYHHTDAHATAYDSKGSRESIRVQACKLMAQEKIIERIQELRDELKQEIIKEVVYDKTAHIRDLEDIQRRALSDIMLDSKALSVALKAIELKGKASELYNFVQKNETDITSGGEAVVMSTITVNGEALQFNVGEPVEPQEETETQTQSIEMEDGLDDYIS